MLFEVWYIGFGQFIAAIAPNELLASLLVPFFFLFVVSFAGIVVPYQALPTFWRRWMYWLVSYRSYLCCKRETNAPPRPRSIIC